MALQDGYAPRHHPLPGARPRACDLDVRAQRAAGSADLRYALSNSLGFGGHNACILLQQMGGLTMN